MKDDFAHIKKTWHLHADMPVPNYEQLQSEIAHLRRQKKNRVMLWSSAVILFSVFIIGYVVYTDELNSIYKSISEFILLFTSIYLFGYSWKTINRQKKEYLLNSRDFIRSLSEREKSDIRTPVFKGCLCVSFLMIALFFYFLDDLLLSPNGLLVSGVVLVAGLVLLWGIVKPVYGKRINETFVHRINIILKQLNAS